MKLDRNSWGKGNITEWHEGAKGVRRRKSSGSHSIIELTPFSLPNSLCQIFSGDRGMGADLFLEGVGWERQVVDQVLKVRSMAEWG